MLRRAYPQWYSSSSAFAAAAVFRVGGQGHSWGRAQGLKLVFIPRPGRLNATLLLFSFSSGATGFFFPANESDEGEGGKRGEVSLSKEGLRTAFWGAGPASQLDGDGLRVYWVPVSSVSPCLSHTPLHSCPHTSLFHAPLGLSCLPVPPPPAAPVPAALLPGSDSHTGNHSFPLCT